MSHVPFPVEKTCTFVDHRSSAKAGSVLRIDGTITASITSLSMFIVGDDGVERTEPYALTPYDVSYVDGHLTHLRKFKDAFGIWQEVREEFVRVPAHNTEGISPVAFTYHVDLMVFEDGSFVEHVEFDVAAPVGETVNLSNVAPVAASNGVQIVRGPKGDKGDTGAPGQIGPAGFEFKDDWAADVDYVNRDVVYLDGTSWFANGEPPLGEVPSEASTFWHPLSLHGAQGDKGDKGDPGDTVIGPPGATPNITPAVTELPAGSAMTVTKTGPPTDVTFTFGLPVPAEPAPSEGGGGGAVQTTGWWRYGSGFAPDKFWLSRTGNECRMIIQSNMTPGDPAERYPLPPQYGAGPGFNPFMAVHGVMMGDEGIRGHARIGQGPIHCRIVRTDELNAFAFADISWLTLDEFPENVILPGFTEVPEPITPSNWSY